MKNATATQAKNAAKALATDPDAMVLCLVLSTLLHLPGYAYASRFEEKQKSYSVKHAVQACIHLQPD
jgi:hypothetical protein